MSWALAIAIKPIVAGFVLWLICWPIKRAVYIHMRECRMKRILFFSWSV